MFTIRRLKHLLDFGDVTTNFPVLFTTRYDAGVSETNVKQSEILPVVSWLFGLIPTVK